MKLLTVISIVLMAWATVPKDDDRHPNMVKAELEEYNQDLARKVLMARYSRDRLSRPNAAAVTLAVCNQRHSPNMLHVQMCYEDLMD